MVFQQPLSPHNLMASRSPVFSSVDLPSRFPFNCSTHLGLGPAQQEGRESEEEEEEDIQFVKTWNLRPRKPVNVNVSSRKGKGQKRKYLSVVLRKEEIEEDFMRITGAKPPKKPLKRPRNLQRLIDGCFPGLWLTAVTPAMYRVPDPPLKG